MQNNLNKGSLANKFENFGAIPSDGLWTNIEAELDEKETKRRGIYWWWVFGASAAAVVLVLATAKWNKSELNESKSVQTVQTDDESIEANDHINSPIEKEGNSSNLTDQNQTTINSENTHIDLFVQDQNEADKVVEQTIHMEQDVTESNQPEEKQIDIDQGNDVGTTFITQSKEKITLLNRGSSVPLDIACVYPRLNLNDISRTKNKRPWEVGFSAAYWTTSSFEVQKELNTANYTGTPGTSSNIADSYEESISPSPNGLVYGTVKKNINVSVFAGKYFSDRWSFRFGLDYSRSTFRSVYNFPDAFLNTSNSSATTTTYLSMMGIPLSINFDCVQANRYKLKTALTLVNDIPFYRTEDQINTMTADNNPSQFISGYMGGVQLGLMNDFRIGRNLNLSVTPAYRYYIIQKVNMDVPLIKKKHWLGGSIGLTWTL